MGQLEICGTFVEKDETGKVKAVYGQDVESVERLSEQIGLPLKTIRACEPEREDVTFAAVPSVNPFLEVCMLKSILLTFDHLLTSDPERFTRSHNLQGCRDLVRDYVLDIASEELGRMDLADYSLGLQYEPEYRGRYEQILAKAELESRPFAHQLIVSSNPDTSTLDAVFVAFGEDPHAFRLSKSWHGPPQTFVMTNGILKNEAASEVVELREAWTLGKPNNRKSFITFSGKENEPDMEPIANEIAEHRFAIVLKAIEYEQMHSDEAVIGQIERTATESWNTARSISLAIFDRMLVLFDADNRDDDRRDRLVELIGDDLDKAGADVLSSELGSPKLGWDHWLKVHRDCFKKLMREFGSPGRLYVQRAEIRRGDPIYLSDRSELKSELNRE